MHILKDYTIKHYEDDIKLQGLDDTWANLLFTLVDNKFTIQDLKNTLFDFDTLGDLYEYGLAFENKDKKKALGQYYTPQDVAKVMAELLLDDYFNEVIVDVACGTGNLIIEVIKLLGTDRTIRLLESEKIALVDIDKTALNIAIYRIGLLIGLEHAQKLDIVNHNYLEIVNLLRPTYVISNPPYGRLAEHQNYSDIADQSRDLYAEFMNKITNEATKAVIITPQSFLVSDKFSLLREALNSRGGGSIYSFDNVPGNIFNGRKHGVFNTNTANSTRPSITVFKAKEMGYRLTHLIRFKTEQRDSILNIDFLNSKLGSIKQNLSRPLKRFKELELLNPGVADINDYLEHDKTKQRDDLKLTVVTSYRYFTVATKKDLDRTGKFYLYAKNETYFNYLYALLNSSWVYMWLRALDGGILITQKLLKEIPMPIISEENYIKLYWEVEDIKKLEQDYVVHKLNAGKQQESVKFDKEIRDRLNKIIFKDYAEHTDLLHSNEEVI